MRKKFSLLFEFCHCSEKYRQKGNLCILYFRPLYTMFHNSCHRHLKNQVHLNGMTNFQYKGTKLIYWLIQFFCQMELRQRSAKSAQMTIKRRHSKTKNAFLVQPSIQLIDPLCIEIKRGRKCKFLQQSGTHFGYLGWRQNCAIAPIWWRQSKKANDKKIVLAIALI